MKHFVNEQNRSNKLQLQSKDRNIPIKEALDKGAMALFGEKYGDSVRMRLNLAKVKNLCGGIHVKNTAADIWQFQNHL